MVRNRLQFGVLSKHIRLTSFPYLRSLFWHPGWFPEFAQVTEYCIGYNLKFF